MKYVKILLKNTKILNFLIVMKLVQLNLQVHGSFSAIIGYLSFFSQIYYPEFKENKIWCGDIFSIPNWNKISF